MAEAFLETTKWGRAIPNHTYYLEGDRALAYINLLDGKVKYFSKPLQIDKRGRTFVKADNSLFTATPADPCVVEVSGSKGTIYYVNTLTGSCDCAGYKFRGKCKHSDEILSKST